MIKCMHDEEVKVDLILQSIGTRVDMLGKNWDLLFMVQEGISIVFKEEERVGMKSNKRIYGVYDTTSLNLIQIVFTLLLIFPNAHSSPRD